MKFYLYTRIDILGYTKSHRDVANYCFFSPEIVDLKQVAAQQLATAPDSNPGPGDPGWDGRQKVGRSGKKGHFGCIFNIKSPSHLEWKKNWNSGNHWIFEFLLWLNQGHRSFLSSLGLDWLEAQTWSTPSIQNCQRMAWYKMATRPLVNKSYKPTPTPTSKKKHIFRPNLHRCFALYRPAKRQVRTLPTNPSSKMPMRSLWGVEKVVPVSVSLPSALHHCWQRRPRPGWPNFQTTGLTRKHVSKIPLKTYITWFLSCKYLSQQEIINFVLFDFPVVY